MLKDPVDLMLMMQLSGHQKSTVLAPSYLHNKNGTVLFVCASVTRITAKVVGRFTERWCYDGPTSGENRSTLVVIQSQIWILDHYGTIEHFKRLAVLSHWPFFTELGRMTDADKTMNPLHFGINMGFESWITFGQGNPSSLVEYARCPQHNFCKVVQWHVV